MDLKDQVKQLSDRVAKMKDKILTEEATKNDFIMPFINCLKQPSAAKLTTTSSRADK